MRNVFVVLMIMALLAHDAYADAPNQQRLKECSVTLAPSPASVEKVTFNRKLVCDTIDPDSEPLFCRSILWNSEKVVEFLKNSNQMGSRNLLSFVSNNGSDIVFDTVLFDRGSRTLVVIVSGLLWGWPQMIPYVRMFDQYDVLMFDFRDHGFSGLKADDPLINGKDVASLGYNGERPYIKDRKAYEQGDTTYWGWGDVEVGDVRSIVEYYRNQKKQQDGQNGYERVIGVGTCYAAYVFVRAQAQSPNLFDKLILEGMPESPVPRYSVPSKRMHVSKFIEKIEIPIMFVHGNRDGMVPKEALKRVADSVHAPFCILHTHATHATSYLGAPEAHKAMSTMFIDHTIEECAAILKSANNEDAQA